VQLNHHVTPAHLEEVEQIAFVMMALMMMGFLNNVKVLIKFPSNIFII
jgi:hypothetical protein